MEREGYDAPWRRDGSVTDAKIETVDSIHDADTVASDSPQPTAPENAGNSLEIINGNVGGKLPVTDSNLFFEGGFWYVR